MVELYADASTAPVGTATQSPFTVTWNTTGLANGAHTLRAKGYDDAGNVGFSVTVPVTVSNYPAPSTSVTSPTGGASGLTGTVGVTAAASAASGLSVSKVELYVDGALYGTPDTTAPYGFSWNTLDPAQPAYDGSHTLTTKVYDSSGQVVTSAPVTVSIANTAGTQCAAGLTSSAVPQAMAFDPGSGTQLSYPVDVTVTNRSAVTWTGATTALRYRWVGPSPTDPVVDTGNLAPLALAANQSTTVRVEVAPPTLPDGVDQAQFRLRFDVVDTSTTPAVFAADRGNPPLDNPVIVNKVLATKLGLEHYHKYVTTDAGGGLQSLANVANGNELLTLRPINEPGRGLSTVVGLTYNSLEEHSESPVGNNWSLSISSLTRFGSPIDIHPNNADSIAGRANRWISIVDGDGTLLRFDGADCGGVVCWQEPPGVHLYLRQVSTTDTTRWWAFTRPDRVTFFYSKYGYPTFVRDRNGNELTFTLTAVQPGDDPGGRSST